MYVRVYIILKPRENQAEPRGIPSSALPAVRRQCGLGNFDYDVLVLRQVYRVTLSRSQHTREDVRSLAARTPS